MGQSIFYLHGFASSPTSTKAAYLTERFRRHGVALRCPDFNQPDFATLTLTRMLGQLDREMAAAGAGMLSSGSCIPWRPATIALACLAVLMGLPRDDAVPWVRAPGFRAFREVARSAPSEFEAQVPLFRGGSP